MKRNILETAKEFKDHTLTEIQKKIIKQCIDTLEVEKLRQYGDINEARGDWIMETND